MALYLLHQTRTGMPVGVWRSPDEYYYPVDQSAKQSYGENVMQDMGDDTSWDDWAEKLASGTPSVQDKWDTYEADGTLELPEVLQEARSNTGFTD